MLTLLAILMACIAYGQSKKVTTIEVKDVRKTREPKHDAGRHKHHDAEVFRATGLGPADGYTLVYYQAEQGTMKYHKAMSVSNEDFDKADYSWNKDTISVRIYNNITNKEVKFRAYGQGSGSSMMTDK